MSVLPILTGQDHPMLRTKTKKVSRVTKEIRKLLRDMAETMIAAEGVGLAAPQVGHSLRLCLAPIGGQARALVNPEITWRSKETGVEQEGCLSLPGIVVPVERALEVTVAYTDIKGKRQKRLLALFEARVVQHELDHLDGVLIVDHRRLQATVP